MADVMSAGTRLWWDANGTGSPLILIQGLGYPSDAWWRLRPALSKRFRVVVMDNRGVGRTEVTDRSFSIEDMADDVAAVLVAAGETSAHVFGASLGGVIAQELALRHPRLVRSLTLGCTGPGGADAVASEAVVHGFLRMRADMTPREAADASVPLVYADDTSPAEIAEDIDVRMTIPTSRAGYAAQLSAVLRYQGSLRRLGAVRAPTLVLHGTADRLIPPANATLLAQAIPDARLHWLEGAGHIFTTDRTAQTLEVVTKFIDSVDQHFVAQQSGVEAGCSVAR